MMCGFRTESALADTNLPNKWAQYMKGGDYVWSSWIRAIDDSSWWDWFTHYRIGMGAVVAWSNQFGNPATDPTFDRLNSYCSRPSPDAGMWYLYQY